MVNLVALCARCGAKREDLNPWDVWSWFAEHAETCVPKPEPRPYQFRRRGRPT